MKQADKFQAAQAAKAKAQQDALEFFHDSRDTAYASVPVHGHRETWRIDSHKFWLWVARTLTEHLRFPPPKCLVNDAVEEFEMWAICDGPTLNVHVRVAELGETIYLDLANDEWQSLEISADGWRAISEAPVKFRRDKAADALPRPVRGGEPRELSRFLNVRQQDEILLLAWLTYAFRPRGPYPILALSGVQGSGKSTLTKVLRALVDPSRAELSGVPRDERSLVMAASNSRLLAFDNLSEIKPQMSDAFCRIATGGAHRERKYYTNDGSEEMFVFQNPVIMNGISELPQRADLLDRSILVHLEPISEEHRRTETAFWNDFEDARPRLLGAILDVVSAGLRNVGQIQLPTMPRLADFCRWGCAVEQALGFDAGDFLNAYRLNLADANSMALEMSCVAWTIHDFVMAQPDRIFLGTSLVLLQELNKHVELREGLTGPLATVRKHPRWPKSASALSAEIARAATNLATIGVLIERGRTNAARWIRLEAAGTRDSDDCDDVPEKIVTERLAEEQGVAPR